MSRRDKEKHLETQVFRCFFFAVPQRLPHPRTGTRLSRPDTQLGILLRCRRASRRQSRCRVFLLFAYGCTAAVLHIKGQIKACAVVQRVGAGLVLPAVLAGHVAFMAVGQGALCLPPLGLYQPVCKRPGGWVVCLYPAHQRPAVQGTRFIRGNVTTV